MEHDTSTGMGGVQAHSKKRKLDTPLHRIRLAIQLAAKENQWDLAYKQYLLAKKEQVHLPADTYNVLLFLCSGGEQWEERCSVPGDSQDDSGASAESTAVGHAAMLDMGQDLFNEMQHSFGTPSEMCFTALARLAAAAGDGDRALELGEQLLAAGIPAKLRSFTPALHAFAASGQANSALKVYARMIDLGLELTENDYRLVIQAAMGSSTYGAMQAIFLRMGDEFTILQAATVNAIEAYFKALKPLGESWTLSRETVAADGTCISGGAPLQAVDLSPLETQTFSEGVKSLAERFEKGGKKFGEFGEWLGSQGAADIVIDGANVAFYGQNFARGGFSFQQIMLMVHHLAEVYPGRKPLVVLHTGRVRNLPKQPQEVRDFFGELESKGSFYVAPQGSNDDWYWLYAAVLTGQSGILVSNDEMRDHTFQLLAPRYFDKWKQRHQMRYKISERGVELQLPPPYTACIQLLEDGAWMFPISIDTWLRALPCKTAELP